MACCCLGPVAHGYHYQTCTPLQSAEEWLGERRKSTERTKLITRCRKHNGGKDHEGTHTRATNNRQSFSYPCGEPRRKSGWRFGHQGGEPSQETWWTNRAREVCQAFRPLSHLCRCRAHLHVHACVCVLVGKGWEKTRENYTQNVLKDSNASSFVKQ